MGPDGTNSASSRQNSFRHRWKLRPNVVYFSRCLFFIFFLRRSWHIWKPKVPNRSRRFIIAFRTINRFFFLHAIDRRNRRTRCYFDVFELLEKYFVIVLRLVATIMVVCSDATTTFRVQHCSFDRANKHCCVIIVKNIVQKTLIGILSAREYLIARSDADDRVRTNRITVKINVILNWRKLCC